MRLPISSSTSEARRPSLLVEGSRPRRCARCASRRARPSTVMRPAVAPQRAADDVVDVRACGRPPPAPMRRSCSAKTVPCAMTNRLRSLASRVMTSWASASAGAAARRRARRAVGERHHRDRGAARRGDGVDGSGAAPGACGALARHARRRARPARLGRRATPSRSGARPGPRPRTAARSPARCSSPSRMRPRRASALQQHLVRAPVERREPQPGLEMADGASSSRRRRATAARAARRGSRGSAGAAP